MMKFDKLNFSCHFKKILLIFSRNQQKNISNFNEYVDYVQSQRWSSFLFHFSCFIFYIKICYYQFSHRTWFIYSNKTQKRKNLNLIENNEYFWSQKQKSKKWNNQNELFFTKLTNIQIRNKHEFEWRKNIKFEMQKRQQKAKYKMNRLKKKTNFFEILTRSKKFYVIV